MDISNEAKTHSVVPRIDQLSARLLPDQKRVRATVVLNDASSRPTVEFTLVDHLQEEIARSTIIGVFNSTVNFTLHLGKHPPYPQLFLKGTIIVNDIEILDSRQVTVESSG